MSVLFFLPERRSSNITSQPHMLLGHIFLNPDISIDNWFHPNHLIGHTHTLVRHRHAMLLSSQGDLLPNLHRLVLFLLQGYHDASLS